MKWEKTPHGWAPEGLRYLAEIAIVNHGTAFEARAVSRSWSARWRFLRRFGSPEEARDALEHYLLVGDDISPEARSVAGQTLFEDNSLAPHKRDKRHG